MYKTLAPLARLILVAVLALLAGGCLDTDVAIRFTDANHGQIEERIVLSDRLSQLDSDAMERWKSQIKQQVQQMGGTARESDGDLRLKVPFFNNRDLTDKFNRLVSGFEVGPQGLLSEPGQSIARFTATRDCNVLVAQRNRLSLDVDLRSLQQVSQAGMQLRQINGLLDGTLRLSAPSPVVEANEPSLLSCLFDGAANQLTLNQSNNRSDSRALEWHIDPERANHLDVAFWVPNPLGVGAVLIAVLVGVGLILQPMFPL
ncbi:MAG: DUF3153 domain-containing protein [Elainellaceae cyanobacterium]